MGDDTVFAVAQLIVAILIFSFVVFLLNGCAMFDSSGQAKYSLEPVILTDADGNQSGICCRVSINNSKNIGTLATSVRRNPETGELYVELMEEGVDAQGPAAAAANAQAEVIKSLIPLIKTPVIK